MANTLQECLILLHLVTLVCCITNSDKKDEFKSTEVDADDAKDDLEPQETGWIFDPLQEKFRTLEYLKNKAFYPFYALKSPTGSFGGSHSYYPGYAKSYPFSGGSSYYPSPKPKQYYYYNPGYTSYQKYPSYPYKTWYNKNYYTSGSYQVHSGYAPNCDYKTGSPTPSPSPPPTYSSGTPVNLYYSVTPSRTYGVPENNFGAKAAISDSSTPTPTSYSGHFQPSVYQAPPSSYLWRVTSSPQYSDDNSHVSSSPSLPYYPSLTSTQSPPLPSIPSSTYAPPSISTVPSLPTTPSPPLPSSPATIVSTTPPSNLPYFPESIPSGPSSFPVPIAYSQGDHGTQEVIITPPPPSLKGHYVTTLPGPKVALPESSSYLYNSHPAYAVSYYPNVFYISNEQRLEKTSSSQTVAGAQETNDGTTDDSSSVSTPSSDSQSSTESTPSTKSQSATHPLTAPGVTNVYTSQTLDQTRIPVSGQFVLPVAPGFYSSGAPSIYSTSGSPSGGPYLALPPAQTEPLTNTGSAFGYPLPLTFTYGKPPVGYQTRTSKNC